MKIRGIKTARIKCAECKIPWDKNSRGRRIFQVEDDWGRLCGKKMAEKKCAQGVKSRIRSI